MALVGRGHVVLSSVPLQVLLYLNSYYFAFFFIAEILMFVYKAWKGNLTERRVPLTLALGLAVPCVLLSLYLLLWQTYVLRAEVIISSILLVFLGFEAVLSCLAIATFAKAGALE
uniref:transmembrane protein 216-like isoform X3 n=1 Tax=Myxine glutinosa TaxID=7769 RepID=UPI00358EF521